MTMSGQHGGEFPSGAGKRRDPAMHAGHEGGKGAWGDVPKRKKVWASGPGLPNRQVANNIVAKDVHFCPFSVKVTLRLGLRVNPCQHKCSCYYHLSDVCKGGQSPRFSRTFNVRTRILYALLEQKSWTTMVGRTFPEFQLVNCEE
jgi:hypothetical protein